VPLRLPKTLYAKIFLKDKSMSDLEKLRIFSEISCYLKDEDNEFLIDKLNLNRDTLSRRLNGFLLEDEFVMILDYLKCAKHIVMLNEASSFLTKSYQCVKWTPMSRHKIRKTCLIKPLFYMPFQV
jgi:hypothetical protein